MKTNKIVIDKDFLKECKSISIGLENCDSYEIDADDIIDIYCEAEPIGDSKNEYRTSDGYIKISEIAAQTPEDFTERNGLTETGYRLIERLEMCDGVDMTSFSVISKEDRNIEIYVPYDSLESVINGGELELSNCSSLEIDADGNMIIAFGERSKQPRRKDNDYAELIAGWKDVFGENEPKVLKVRADSLQIFENKAKNVAFSFKILNKFYKNGFAELFFKDCDFINVDMYFPQRGNCEIAMSRMKDGRIYVGFAGLGIDFTCAEVYEYKHYCNETADDDE